MAQITPATLCCEHGRYAYGAEDCGPMPRGRKFKIPNSIETLFDSHVVSKHSRHFDLHINGKKKLAISFSPI